MLRMNRQVQLIVKKSIISVFDNEEILDKIAVNITSKVLQKLNEKLEEQRPAEMRNVDLLEAYFRPNSVGFL